MLWWSQEQSELPAGGSCQTRRSLWGSWLSSLAAVEARSAACLDPWALSLSSSFACSLTPPLFFCLLPQPSPSSSACSLNPPPLLPPDIPSPPPPLQVEFGATKTLCDVRVESVVDAQSGQPVKYGSRTQLTTDGYHVE